jgi:hypothetical protein
LDGDKVTDSERIAYLEHTLDSIEGKVDTFVEAFDKTLENVNAVIAKIEPHLENLGPMIDSLANNPMFRMFTGGKKR